jgi:hypothetical protein
MMVSYILFSFVLLPLRRNTSTKEKRIVHNILGKKSEEVAA